MSFRVSSPFLFLRGLALPAAVIAVVGVLAGTVIISGRELKAAPLDNPRDSDGDGLVNLQESVLGTNKFQADTDGDGFSDLEELARKSSPLFPQSVPEGDRIKLGMTCRGGDTQLHATIAIYLPDGSLRNKSFKAGILVGTRMSSLTEAYLLHHAKLTLHPAADPAAKIAVLDLPISPRLVRHYGHMTVYATVGDDAHGVVQAADCIQLLAFGQTVVLQVANPMSFASTSLGGSGQQTGGSGGGNIGSIYIPLPIGGDSSGWTPGQVCVQQTALIGSSGAMITQEVTSAECQDGWDGYCPSSCASTVGNTYVTVDPLALIGG